MNIGLYHNLPSGGGKRALLEMVKRLSLDHKLYTFTLSTAEHNFCDIRQYCTSHEVYSFETIALLTRPFGRLNQAIRTLDLYRLRLLERRIAEKIDNEGFDLVFVHNCQFGQSPSVLRYLQTPSVYYCAEPPRILYEPEIARQNNTPTNLQKILNAFDPLPGLYKWYLSRSDQNNVSQATLLLTNSAFSRESLYRIYGVFASIGALGVDTERFKPLNRNKKPFLLSVGALTPRKGFDFIIRSLAYLETCNRPSLLIVSNYAEIDEVKFLRELCKKLDVSVEIRIGVTDDELIQLYNEAILTVLAPIMEPFGLVPLESMACGTPVLAIREGGLRETIVHEHTGWLTNRDPVDFAKTLKMLISDKELLDKIGRQGSKYVVDHWSWDAAVGGIEAYLSKVIP